MTLRFEHPWLLLGLLTLAIPWFLRWYQAKRPRMVFWGAMPFLEATLVRQARVVRRKERWQLLVRMGILALTVLAVARPAWAPRRPARPIPGQPYLLLLFDDSYSMQLRHGELSHFEIAKQQAIQWMERQNPEARYSVLTFSQAIQLGEHIKDIAVYSDVESTREALLQLQPGFRADTFAEVLSPVQTLMRSRAEPFKQVCVLTDGQRYAWQDVPLDTLDSNIYLRLILPPRHAVNNAGVSALDAQRRVVPVGQPVVILCTVTNTGTTKGKEAWLTLSVRRLDQNDSTPIANLHAPVAPRASHTFEVSYRFPSPGIYAITAQLPPDDLPVDNQRQMLIRVVSRFRVLSVGPHQRYLRLALAPTEGGSIEVGTSEAVPASLRARNDEGSENSGYDALILTRPWNLTEMRRIETYLREGGVVLVFAGPEFAAPFERAPAWLPAALADRPIEGSSFEGATVQQRWQLTPRPGSRIVLRDDRGDPIAVEADFGKGRCALVGTTAGPPWNDWHIQPAFLPWLHRRLISMWQAIGAPPEGEIGKPPSIDGEAEVAWPEKPGVHQVRGVGPVALNPAMEEMDLRTLPVVWFWQHWPQVEAYIAFNDRISLARRSYALWPWMWGIALLLVCGEVWMSRPRPSGTDFES